MNARRLALAIAFCVLVAQAAFATSNIVISQIYGGGGNSGATYKNDFIEIFNRGASTQSLAGWSVQYASSAGSSWQVTNLTGSIAPGHYYLIQEAAGAAGSLNLPTPDATGAGTGINMSATAGKVALVSSMTALTCGATNNCTGVATVVDLIGFGTASSFEGTGPSATLSNTAAALRASNGCVDTDNNPTDFDTVNTPVTKAVNIAVNAANNPPSITAPANPITTVEENAPAFTVNLSGTDDGSIYNWSAIPGTGVSTVSVTGGQGTSTATFTVNLLFGFSGTATFTASLSDNVNAPATQAVNITVNAPPPPANHIVISQIYGGGGNSGAPYNSDFIELYNPTASPVDVTGWSVQYASAAGTSWANTQPIGGPIGPGEYYLIALATGATGAPLPAANISGSINMSSTTGKVALVSSGDPLSGGCPLGNPLIVDFIGYGGSATCKEGSTVAPLLSNTTADIRKNGGATDTDVNGSDFVAGAPNPRRTAIISEIGPFIVTVDPLSGASIAPYDSSITVVFSEPVTVDSGWYDITCASGSHNDATLASTDSGSTWVITPNVSFNPGEACTVTIFKTAVHDVDTDDSGPNSDTLPANKVWSFSTSTGDPAPYAPSVHLTMGNPSNAIDDVNVPNNYLMVKPTYALSYNSGMGRPNWVSWHLDTSWYGSLARVDTFRPDPKVPSDWYRVQAFDFSLSGFDRGHMTPNADRDNQNRIPINQETYLMSNMVAQSPDNNQGPWANLENYLRSLTDAGSEVYIVSGPSGVGGTGSNGGVTTTVAGGHVTVPSSTWKVALVLPKLDGNDIARVTAATRIIAVVMPNIQGIRTVDWQTYLTSVDAVEALTGYDLFSNIPEAVQNAIEAGVNGVNPPGTANQSVSTSEDNAKSFTLTVAIPNNNPLTYTIVSTPSHGQLTGTDGNRTYTPAPDYNGNDTFTYNVSDGTHTSNTSTVTLTISEVNDPPAAADDAKSTDEDAPLTFAASDLAANDSTGPANESSQTLTVTTVSATASTHGNVILSSGNVTYTPDVNFNGPASFTYQVCDNGTTAGLTDSLCTTATVNMTVNAVNDPPSAAIDAPSTGAEGTLISVSGLATDIDDTSFTYAWSVTKNGSPYVSGSGTPFTFTPDDNGTYAVSLIITDAHSGTGSASASIAVSNVDPAISAVTGPIAPIALGSSSTIVISYSDAGSADTHTATLTWDDTTSSTVSCAAGTCTATHTFTATGVYHVGVTVTDDDGGSATSDFQYVVVFDPAAGFVTGGGWINSPAGAYVPSPDLSGKATFGFVSKYQKGQSTPSGNTQFQFSAAGFRFASTSYDWLVIAGAKAQYKGTGVVTNSTATYGFLLTATDGDMKNGNAAGPDKFRIKIWDIATSNVVYDNVLGGSDDVDAANPQVLGGGNIQIQSNTK
jgi:endonuclease G